MCIFYNYNKVDFSSFESFLSILDFLEHPAVISFNRMILSSRF